jgi:hypothetical protein
MPGTSLKFDGLAELRGALHKLPAELVAEASAITLKHANAAASAIVAAYPMGPTGNLKQGVSVTVHGTGVSTSATVRNRAYHAWLFEHGTKAARHWSKGSTTAPFRRKGSRPVPVWGIGRSTGRMPAGDVLIPIAIAHRRAMRAELIALVERAGFTVISTTA